jgi:hypothetical protein
MIMNGKEKSWPINASNMVNEFYSALHLKLIIIFSHDYALFPKLNSFNLPGSGS